MELRQLKTMSETSFSIPPLGSLIGRRVVSSTRGCEKEY